jgi:hypothetical protein
MQKCSNARCAAILEDGVVKKIFWVTTRQSVSKFFGPSASKPYRHLGDESAQKSLFWPIFRGFFQKNIKKVTRNFLLITFDMC